MKLTLLIIAVSTICSCTTSTSEKLIGSWVYPKPEIKSSPKKDMFKHQYINATISFHENERCSLVCDYPSGDIFKNSGTWTLDENKLTITITETTRNNKKMGFANPPKSDMVKIINITKNELTLFSEKDGKNITLKRKNL